MRPAKQSAAGAALNASTFIGELNLSRSFDPRTALSFLVNAANDVISILNPRYTYST
jgi:hypothetical protein